MPVRYAGFWIRFLADILDSILLTVVSWVLEYLLLGIVYGVWVLLARNSPQPPPSFGEAFNAFWLQVVNMGLYFVIAFPYYVWGHFRYGTTLGKRPFRIYVVRAQGTPELSSQSGISLAQSIGRFFAYGLSYALFLVGFIMAAFHPEKRALHDVLAGTVSVIRPKPAEQAPTA